MGVHGCHLVAIEGTHASGKTTLAHALVAHYRAQGVVVGCTGEPARASPFIDDIVIHDRGDFDLVTEVDLFGAQLTDQLRSSRHLELLICDKTIINVLAYARLVLDARRGSQTAAVLDAMTSFCTAWASIYDAVFYCADSYHQPTDPLRAKVAHLQDATADAVLDACTDCGVALHHIPAGLTVADRVHWVSQQLRRVLKPQQPGR